MVKAEEFDKLTQRIKLLDQNKNWIYKLEWKSTADRTLFCQKRSKKNCKSQSQKGVKYGNREIGMEKEWKIQGMKFDGI